MPATPKLEWLLVGGVAVVAMGLLLWEESDGSPEAESPKPLPPPDPPKPKPTEPRTRRDTDDETALARMLASEDPRSPDAWVVIGWLTIESARRAKKSLFLRLTSGAGYGPRIKDGVRRYAATDQDPTARTRRIAAALLAGDVLPSAAIRARPAASWVEDLKNTDATAAAVLRAQKDFGRIWGRVAGTRWYLFDERARPLLEWTPQTAKKVLATVPSVPALDVPLDED